MLTTEKFYPRSSPSSTRLLEDRISATLRGETFIDWPDGHLRSEAGDPVSFHVAQAEAWESERRYINMVAGTQSGKTAFGPWWQYREIIRKDGGDHFAVTATYDLFRLKMLPEILAVYEGILEIGRYWAGDKILEICENAEPGGRFLAKKASDPMWARIILRSADSTGGLESASVRSVWADEAGQDRFKVDSWRALKRRIALHQARVLITTTLYNLGWIKTEIIDPAAETGEVRVIELENGAEVEITDSEEADSVLVQFDSIVNPAMPMDAYLDAQATLPDDEFQLFWRGRVARLRNLVYDIFDDKVHVIPAFEVPKAWPRVVGVDPFGAKIAALWLAFDTEKKVLHVYREYLEPFGITTGDHAANIRKLSTSENVVAWVGGGPSERQARLDFSSYGVPLQVPDVTEVWAQIDRVYSLLKIFRLYVHDSCPNLIHDLGSMKRKRDASGEPTDKIENKEIYDSADALRYAIAWLIGPGEVTEVVYDPVRIQ